MEEQYAVGKKYFDEKNYVEALKIFSEMDYLDSRSLENQCIDYLEDLIYFSRKKKALEYLEQLKFYKEYVYFTDAYKRKKINFISKILMFGSAIIGTIIFILLMVM